jgi:L-fuconolactonase
LVDTHVHVWDARRLRYPWLEAHPALDRTVCPVDAGADTRAIFVQADSVPEQGIAEVRYVESLDWPTLAGIVAFAPLEASTVEQALEELAAHPLVVGIRRLLQDEPAGFASSASFIAGLASVARHGFVFDATVRADQLDELVLACRSVPEVVVVLDHLGNPALVEGLDSTAGRDWLRGISTLASEPSVVAKLSGAAAGDERRGRPFALAALDAFGPDRLLLGSDHPLTVPNDAEAYQQWAATAEAELGLTGDERAAVRRDTAIRTYRLKENDR